MLLEAFSGWLWSNGATSSLAIVVPLLESEELMEVLLPFPETVVSGIIGAGVVMVSVVVAADVVVVEVEKEVIDASASKNPTPFIYDGGAVLGL